MKKQHLSVIIPTYKEAENLNVLLPRITKLLREESIPHETVVVDDDSDDGTAELIKKFADDGLPVRCITRTGERDLSTAVLCGFSDAVGDILIVMDADLSHPPESLPGMYRLIASGDADFVVCSRYSEGASTGEGWALFRWLNSKAATLLARPFTTVSDPMSGFFGLLKKDYLAIADRLNPIGYKIGLELLAKGDFKKVSEIPIHFAPRKIGKSKMNISQQFRYVHHIIRLWGYLITGRK